MPFGKLCLSLLIVFLSCSVQAGTADFILVDKSERKLYLYRKGVRTGTFNVTFGKNPYGPKRQAGDHKTPEGWYIIDAKKRDSGFYKALHISYPNRQDKADAQARGVTPGGDIMIHGQKNGFEWAAPITMRRNWTNGCIAMSDEDMDRVFAAVDQGTRIWIRP